MPEEQYETLNEGDLDQNVAQPDGHEIEEWKRRLAPFSTPQHEGQDEKQHDGDR